MLERYATWFCLISICRFYNLPCYFLSATGRTANLPVARKDLSTNNLSYHWRAKPEANNSLKYWLSITSLPHPYILPHHANSQPHKPTNKKKRHPRKKGCLYIWRWAWKDSWKTMAAHKIKHLVWFYLSIWFLILRWSKTLSKDSFSALLITDITKSE